MLATETEYLTTGQVAKRFGKSRDTVRWWIKRGVRLHGTAQSVRLRGVRFGKNYHVTQADVEEFIKAVNPHVDELPEEETRAKAAASAAGKRLKKRLRMD